jgi:hypothetical protein
MRTKSFAALLLACLSSLALMPQSQAQEVDVAVVVNPSSSVGNVSLADLRKIFSGEKRSWPGGSPIRLILRAPGCHERQVLLKLVRMSEADYKQFWTAQVFRGEAEAEPFAVPSFGMAKEAANTFPGAITLVDAHDVKPGMKIIKVDGLLPGAEGYPLH